ncbi:MAG: hypothetical protein ACQESR_11815 [Planctomycetota bacterium]
MAVKESVPVDPIDVENLVQVLDATSRYLSLDRRELGSPLG